MALLVGGIVLNGAATAAYLGAHFGPGPRDGLMNGLVRPTGRSVRLVRKIIEGSVMLSGFLLGGTLGLGTVAYLLMLGPFIPALLTGFHHHAPVSPHRSEERRWGKELVSTRRSS